LFAAQAWAAPGYIRDGTFALRARKEILDNQIKARILSNQQYSREIANLGRISGQLTVGTQHNFQAYNFASGQYESRTGTLKGVGTRCYVFVADDSISNLGASTDRIVSEIQKTFDEKIFPACTDWFGTVNLPSSFSLPDDKIYIFLLDIRDGIGGGYVAGYFDSRDLEGMLGNKKPVFFMDVNPGNPGDPTNKNNDFYKTLAHEFQHMINFSKRLPESGRSQEDRWVEEGLSGFSEYVYTEMVGDDGIGLAPTPHLSRYLENPNLVLTQNSDTEWFSEATLFRHYGASFLYLYYLQEKYGGASLESRKAFIRSLVDSPYSGIANIHNLLSAKGTTFADSMKNWLLANHLNDVSLNNGLWGYQDKETRLGKEADGLPIAGNSHSFSADGMSFIGGEGRILSNAGKYEVIQGSGNLQLSFQGKTDGLTPFLGLIDFAGGGTLRDLSLDGSGAGSLSLDLSTLRKAVLVPAALTSQANVTTAFYYSFSGASAKVVVYPLPNPVFANEFMIVLKSLGDAITATPIANVTFNNLNYTPVMSPTDQSRTVFVANFSIPGDGEGQAVVTIGDVSSSFTFFSAALKANIPARLKLKDTELSISSRVDGDQAFLYESGFVEVPQELSVISKPFYASFNAQNAIEARLQFEGHSAQVQNPEQVGLWAHQNASFSWIRASQNDRGYASPISHEGMYVLTCDTMSPRVHDLHVEEVNGQPTLSARLSDGGSGLNLDSLRCEVNGQSFPFSLDSGKGALTADLSRLPKGQHRFEVKIQDRADNLGRAILAQALTGPLKIAQVTAYPNPSRGAANIAVILDGNGANDPMLEIEARIYDASGKLVTSMPLSYKTNRTFVARWNQKNDDLKQVANGYYPFKVFVRKGGDELKGTGKIAILN
jgi:hypothetical protein